MSRGTLVIAGGGTGGHIFPGIAIAEEWQSRGGKAVFVGTPAGKEKDLVPPRGFDLRLLKVGQLKGAGILRKLKTMLQIPVAVWQARGILRVLRPEFVLGVGGYASGPMCLAARLSGYFTVITEQNVAPGLTNRVLGKIAHRIYMSFAGSAAFFPAGKTILVGNPVRQEIQKIPYVAPRDRFCIFVFGGSQGAVSLNKAFTEALSMMPEHKQYLKIIHQAGASDLDDLKAFYKDGGWDATVSAFFNDMVEQYRQAHLVISRAGASTLTELARVGRPALLVPYPFASDDHQKKNAVYFTENNAAWLVDQKELTPEWLKDFLVQKIQHPQELEDGANRMAALAVEDSAKKLIDDLLRRGKV